LYAADFGVETTQDILTAIQTAFKKEKQIRSQDVIEICKHVLRKNLDGAQATFQPGFHQPEVIALIGINGAGKTTTCAKLAYWLKKRSYGVLMGACDTFRAAANEQIDTWSKKLEIELVKSHHGADAAAVAFDTYQAAQKRGTDVVLLDTAGRLHTKTHLMEELKKIRQVLAKKDPQAPHHLWLVLDASLGSNSIAQAQAFHDALGLTGLIVTKLDGTSRGGALVGIYRQLQLPVYFVGVGEAPEDLEPFDVQTYVDSLFDPTE